VTTKTDPLTLCPCGEKQRGSLSLMWLKKSWPYILGYTFAILIAFPEDDRGSLAENWGLGMALFGVLGLSGTLLSWKALRGSQWALTISSDMTRAGFRGILLLEILHAVLVGPGLILMGEQASWVRAFHAMFIASFMVALLFKNGQPIKEVRGVGRTRRA